MKRDQTLAIAAISKHQYYYKPTGGKAGRKPSSYTSNFTEKMITENFIEIEEKSFRKNWEMQAFTDLKEKTTTTYGDFA